VQSLADMVRLEIRESLQDLFGGHVIGDHRNARGDRDPQLGMLLWVMTSNEPSRRAGIDACATYLTNKRLYLDYPKALKEGWPIATGVIEGACRHLIKDRMDITGARWGLEGAEAVLKLRALCSNGDFNNYWAFHLAQERRRVHESRYAKEVIPRAA